jgi:hypothetical protein
LDDALSTIFTVAVINFVALNALLGKFLVGGGPIGAEFAICFADADNAAGMS